MKVKELIEILKSLESDEDIYFASRMELYTPIIQGLWDSEAQENYYIITME